MTNKQKILIVDDDENIAELISLYLTKECFDTQIVHDGEEALQAFERSQPDLILLDLMLPGIDGYQVCREVRAKSQTPIIMLSAKGEVFDKVLGLDLIANAKESAENAGAVSADIPDEVMELVEQRKAARKDKNFALADELRDKIAALGYEVKETRQGTEINKL